MSAPSGSLAPEIMRIRRSRSLILVGLLPTFLVAAIVTLVSIDLGRRLWLAVPFVLVAGAVGVRFFQHGWGVDLTPTHLVSRWGRTIEIPWDRVLGFQVEEMLGFRALKVLTDDGETRELWAPSALPFFGRAEFDAQHTLIGQWWVDHRSAPQLPMPPSPWVPSFDPGFRPHSTAP